MRVLIISPSRSPRQISARSRMRSTITAMAVSSATRLYGQPRSVARIRLVCTATRLNKPNSTAIASTTVDKLTRKTARFDGAEPCGVTSPINVTSAMLIAVTVARKYTRRWRLTLFPSCVVSQPCHVSGVFGFGSSFFYHREHRDHRERQKQRFSS